MAVEEGVTWFCWSATQDTRGVLHGGYRHAAETRLHLQGVHVGRPETEDVTACGIPTRGYWQFNVAPVRPEEQASCQRCLAALARYRKKGR